MPRKHTNAFTAVVGPGAIGGTLAASLRRRGDQVLLVARSAARAAALKRSGLTITAPPRRRKLIRGWLDITPRPARRPGCRAVFLCVKAAGLSKALAAVRGIVDPATPIVSLINGIGHTGPILRAYGPARAVFGTCYIAAMRTGSATIRHTGGREIALAETPANKTACRAAAVLLRGAGWTVRIVRSPERLLWTKLIHNAAINPLGTLAMRTNGELASEPALRELLVRVVNEAADIAKAAGYPSLDSRPAARVVRGCAAAPDQVNSMAQDIAAGRPTEADAILKPLITAARRNGRPVRFIEPLYKMLRVLEGRRP
ncbi:MAG: 2-dehydropantoate 2-reductase [Elusimicrobiota bacterium]